MGAPGGLHLWLLRSGGKTAPCCPGALGLRHAAQESPRIAWRGPEASGFSGAQSATSPLPPHRPSAGVHMPPASLPRAWWALRRLPARSTCTPYDTPLRHELARHGRLLFGHWLCLRVVFCVVLRGILLSFWGSVLGGSPPGSQDGW